MTKEDILKIAKEVNLPYFWESGMPCNLEALEAFAKLVAEHERERFFFATMKATEKAIDVEMALEREVCAVIAETPISGEQDDITMEAKDRVAKAIRARGQE